MMKVKESRYGGKIPQKVEDEYNSFKFPLLPKINDSIDKSRDINKSVKKLQNSSI
jgi:hypothetical protein